MEDYFSALLRAKDECYSIAETARSKGFDPETFVEVPQASDLASRVEKLLYEYGVEGVAEDIRALTEEYKNRELVALMVAKKIAKKPAASMEEALDRATRVGLAVLTEGILVAPLEGIACTRIRKN
ncbi:MAG: DNA polymerase II large subunit, partial [Candidatus Methanomethylophilaceae archaeon]|nr:DNA polymerase II large subunit [Candidatus Methanomethylophilaceae archaeon]